MQKTLLKYLAIVVAAFLVIFALQKINWLPSFKYIFHSQPVVIEETPVIIREINTLSQLVTITYIDEVVMSEVKKGKGMPSLMSAGIGMILVPPVDRLVMIGRGSVIAGIDLKQVGEKDLNTNGDSISVSLPHAQILNTIINPSGYEIFDEKGDWSDEAATTLKVKIKNELTKRALQQGILSKADERSKNIIESFLKNTGFKKIHITF